MKAVYSIIIMVLLVSSILALNSKRNENYVPGDILIMIKNPAIDNPDELLSDICVRYQAYKLRYERIISRHMGIYLLQFNPDDNENNLLTELRSDSDIKHAQFNHYLENREIFPDDEEFSSQWSLSNSGQSGGLLDADIDATDAWEITTGGVTVNGDSIVIAIIDDGFDLNHEDINFWKNTLEIPGDGIDNDGNGYTDDYHGWSAYSHNGLITSASHGTHVAGIAGARTNNFIGTSGVSWGTKIMPVQASSTLESVAMEGYNYVLEMRRLWNLSGGVYGAYVVVTNTSFGVNNGQPEDYPLWAEVYNQLGAVGVLSCGATANASWNIDVVGDIPSACSSDFLITVTNTTRNDLKSTSAGYGLTTIDLGAPGTSVISTVPGNRYLGKSGTSMSSPHVAGTIALMYAAASADFMMMYDTEPATYALLVKEMLLDGVDPLPTLAGITVTGGRLNTFNAVDTIAHFTGTDDDIDTPRVSIQLLDNYPNPFNPSTTIAFNLAHSARVKIEIFNLLGQRVCSLADRQYISGHHTQVWNGKNSQGVVVSSGIYFVKLESGQTLLTQKILMLK